MRSAAAAQKAGNSPVATGTSATLKSDSSDSTRSLPDRLTNVTGPEYLQHAQKMTSSVSLCFSGGYKSGLHVRGQIRSKGNGPLSTIY